MNRPDEHNGPNQITTHQVTGIAHDLRGNITNDGARTFTYDSQNRLVHSGGPNNLWINYDPLGRILSLIHGGAQHEYPDYDGNRMIAEHNGSGAVLRRYVHGPGVDEPLVWYEGSTTVDRRFLHADEGASVIAASDGTGAVLAINRYDEYGIPQGTHTGRFGYAGQAWVERAGIWHYKARMYHPRLGRFLQVDPIGYDDQINLYAYVRNDPVNLLDPRGKQTTCNEERSRCETRVDSSRTPNTGTPQRAGNVTDENRRNYRAVGGPAIYQAGHEVARNLNQQGGDERTYRMDIEESANGQVVITQQVEMMSTGPNGGMVSPSVLTGAEAVLHTEPVATNTGIPGYGDIAVVDRMHIPNLQVYGVDVNAVEVDNGRVQIRPIDHMNTSGLQDRAEDFQARRTKD